MLKSAGCWLAATNYLDTLPIFGRKVQALFTLFSSWTVISASLPSAFFFQSWLLYRKSSNTFFFASFFPFCVETLSRSCICWPRSPNILLAAIFLLLGLICGLWVAKPWLSGSFNISLSLSNSLLYSIFWFLTAMTSLYRSWIGL